MDNRTAQQRGADVEREVRSKFSQYFQKPLLKKRLPIEPFADVETYEVDFFEPEGGIVGEVKAHTWRGGHLFPNGKFENLQVSLFKIHRLRIPINRRILILADDLNRVTGENLVDAYINKLDGDPLIAGFDIWRFNEGRGQLVQIVGRARGLVLGRHFGPKGGAMT